MTREKRLDLQKKQTMRNVYQCHVIGPQDGGKTTFCQGLLGRSIEVKKVQVKLLVVIKNKKYTR